MEFVSKWMVILFGLFFIAVGFLMLFAPERARAILRKAGSTSFINYAEITIRMIPAIGLIIYADYSKFPEVFKLFGWFMLATSLVLYFVPRKWHHNYALRSADMLKPGYIRWLSLASLVFGGVIIYSV